jgi:hypothetical protein
MSNTARITAINHVVEDIACSADALYREILASFVETDRHTAAGYAVELLADSEPAAFRGGYRLTLKDQAGDLQDDRTCWVTERDDAARRVSLRADYHMPAQMGLTVHVTYQAVETPSGARYQIDCHTDVDLDLPEDRSRENIAQVVAALEQQSDDHLRSYIASLRKVLEGTA